MSERIEVSSSPRISVVMSVYKEPVEWIRQSIKSIVNQTFHDFEFIIVNDNPDRKENAQLLNEYALKDNRIRIITNEENIGLTKSLNKGISVAKGEYIARMDADDISLPERFEKQISYMNNHPEIIASGTGSFIIDESGHVCDISNATTDPVSIRTTLIFKTAISHPSAIIRKEFNGISIQYDEHFRFAQDYALWGFLACYSLGNIREPLIKYRISREQISTSRRVEQDAYAREIKQYIINKLQLPFSVEQVLRYTSICESTIEDLHSSQLLIRNMIDSLNIKHDNYLWSSEVLKNFILSHYYFALRNKYSVTSAISNIYEIIKPKMPFSLCKLFIKHEIKKTSLYSNIRLCRRYVRKDVTK